MTTLRHHRTVLLLALFLLLTVTILNIVPERGTTQDLPLTPLPLEPGVRERVVAASFINLLEEQHISKPAFDKPAFREALSKEAFRLYIKSLDWQKLYFYQSDIDEFKTKYESKLCDLIKQQPVNVQPAFEIYNRYLIRIKERVATIRQILSEPFDFMVDEEYTFDKQRDFTLDENVIKAKGLHTFPRTPDEAYERWRKRLKSELLLRKAEIITSEQKREKALAEGKEPPDVDNRDPVERLLKRHVSFQRRMLFEGRIESSEILESIRKQANDDVMEQFLNAIAGALDPHTSYMSPSSQRAFDDDMRKSFQGIGATLSSEDGYIVVMSVIGGSPADKAGIRKKDKIQGVGQGKDGKIEDVIDFKVIDVVKLIRGNKGTMVRLDILPGGENPSKIVEIVRDEIMLEDQAAQSAIFEVGRKEDGTPYKIGFIELPNFYLDMDAARRREANVRSATTDVKQFLGKFVEEKVDAVVLDLRYNGGGVLHEAIELTGLFTGAGVVVQVKDEVSNRPQPRANTDTGCDWTGPLVVITNKFSASASEIFAGAIKDHRRGLVVGDSTSLGKGTVQSVVNLSNRLLVGGESIGQGKITIQGFYRPSGVTTQGIGVEADVVLPSLSDVMENVMESELDNALTLRKVDPASNFSPKQYITPQLVTELSRRSGERVRANEDFAKQLEKVVAYKENRAKRATPLNEAKYMEEMRRFDSDEWEREGLEDLLNKDKKIKRDFYVDEVLAIVVDYIKVTQELGINFPKERTVRQPPRRTFLGNFGF